MTSSHGPASPQVVAPGSASQAGVVGWREWVSLPDLGVAHLKAKIDTGARTSALHADELERFDRDGDAWVRFVVHPRQRSDDGAVAIEAALLDEREVRSSSGEAELRPVVRTILQIVGRRLDVELTLTPRHEMGFRMLVGREALRGRLLVDPGLSYAGGRPPIDVRRANAGRAPATDAALELQQDDDDEALDDDDGAGAPEAAP